MKTAVEVVPGPAWKAVVQILLVLGTIECTLWTEGPAQARWFAVAAGTLIACVLWSRPNLHELGLDLKGFGGAAAIAIPITLIVCSGALVLAWSEGTLRALYGKQDPSWHVLLYAMWALEQQFILNSFFYRRFEFLLGNGTKALVITALLFSLVHIPNPVLVPLTLVGGLFFVELFRRFRNIYPLAIAHAILGITIALTVPDDWLRHMRVGLGFYRFHTHG